MSTFLQQICASIVSHSHGQMVVDLVQQLILCPEIKFIFVTCNVSEELSLPKDPRILRINNSHPKGFGANHNAAFLRCSTSYFCILNPDIRFDSNPFLALLKAMQYGPALCAPIVISPAGIIEDSARRFPSISGLLAKLLGLADGRYHYKRNDPPLSPDWVAGMFMLVPASDFEALGGFDEKYFLYYEDVDFCVRFWRSGRSVVLCTQVAVIHAAQRASHRNFHHFKWHLCSMMRYFYKHWCRQPVR